jgi:alpha-D-xyloside xylohydrolase
MRPRRRVAVVGLALLLSGAFACRESPAPPPVSPTAAEPTPTAAAVAPPAPTPTARVVAPTAPAATPTAARATPTPRPARQPTATPAPRAAVRPPLTPRWVYEPWVWEDEEHTAQAVLDLVDGYRREGIPVGAVIIDSPWQTNYNTFEFGPNYPDPAALIGELHALGVKVLLWATAFVNVSSTDGPERGKAPLYDEARAAGYFVDGGRTIEWWRGEGSAVDFFNPDAVAWWYRQMDRAFALGVDGWKVDNADNVLPERVQTAAGRKSRSQYGEAYYRAFYRYVAERNPEAITLARAYDDGRFFAPVDVNPAGWVGDQPSDWGAEGIGKALDNILVSAGQGYAVLGSDIGGYHHDGGDDELFIRWTQLGALSPLMENGGQGEHRPWKLGREVLAAYRYYAKLHHQLVPYLYSAGVEAHRTGRPIIGRIDRQNRQYTLGQDLLAAPITQNWDERRVRLPADTRWHDYWDDDRVVAGPTVVAHDGPTERAPLFIRAGAIVPMQVDDAETGHGDRGSAGQLTLLVYPAGTSVRTYYPDAERAVALRSRREARGVTVEIGPQTERYVLRIKERARPSEVRLDRGGGEATLEPLPSWEAFDRAAEGWYYDAGRRYLWARFATRESGARLTYSPPR